MTSQSKPRGLTFAVDETVPQGWAWARAEDVCIKIQDGTHFSPKKQLSSGKYRYITAKNIRPYGLDLSNVSYLKDEDHRAIYSRCDAKRDDVLLVKDGVNTGDAAINTLDDEISILSSVCLLRPLPTALSAAFLRYFLLSPSGYRLLSGQMTGTAIKRIILRRIKETPVPIAPIREQNRIVAEIERHLTRLDAAVAALKRVQANLKRYRASMMKAAAEGALTAEWRLQHPYTEPSGELLKRILVERRRRWKQEQLDRFKAKDEESPKNWDAKYKEPVTQGACNLPQLPQGWCWASLAHLTSPVRASVKTGPFGSMLKKHEHRTTGVPVLGIENIDRMRFLRGSKIHISQSKARDLVNYDAKPGDVLISRSGTVGEVCVVPDDIGIARISTNLMRVRLSAEAISPHFFCLLFNGSPAVLSQVASICSGSTRNFLSNEILAALNFPLPPLPEQVAILETLEGQRSVIEHLEADLDAKVENAQRLRQAILRRAFTGQLVPQDPNDEPAAALLERIRKERVSRENAPGRVAGGGPSVRRRGLGKQA
jgi:type I restriction enzyme, S subunit